MDSDHRRFIAGARCPKCKAMDSIVLYVLDGVEKIECIQCDYHESQDDIKEPESAIADTPSVIGVFKPD